MQVPRLWLPLVGLCLMGIVMAQGGGSSVEELIAKLGDPDFQVREQATQDLIALGKPALQALEKAARSEDPEVSWRAQHALDTIRGNSAPKPTEEAPGLEFPKGFEFKLQREFDLKDSFKELDKMMKELENFGMDRSGNGFQSFRSFKFSNGQWTEEGNFGQARVSTEPVTKLLREHLGLPEGQGIALAETCQNLEPYGLQPLDIILAVDGAPIRQFNDLASIFKAPAKSKKSVELVRKGVRQTLEIIIQESAPSTPPPSKPNRPEKRERDF